MGGLYVTAESGIYCIGDPNAPFEARSGTVPKLGEEIAPGAIASIQVVPAEVIVSAGESITFRIRAFDANGRALGEQAAEWSLDGLTGTRLSATGTLSTPGNPTNQSGKVVASVGGVTGSAQVRVFGPLPWAENFEGGRPPYWIGGGGSLRVVEQGGQQLLRKGPSRTGIHRHALYLGPSRMSGYTIQADAMATEKGRRRPGPWTYQQRLHDGPTGQRPAGPATVLGRGVTDRRARSVRVAAEHLVHAEAAG